MNRVLWAAALVALAIVGYHVQRGWSKRTDPVAIQAQVQAAYDDMEAKARADHPDMPLADAMKATSTEMTNQKLASVDPDDRGKTAASFYMGFHWSNTRTRKDYCDARGVDIAPFVSAFESAHAQELARATAILSSAGMDPEAAYPLIKPQMTQAIEQDMRDVAKGANVAESETCQLFVDNAEQIVGMLVLPPAVKQALTEA
jgi:hypothetical protein